MPVRGMLDPRLILRSTLSVIATEPWSNACKQSDRRWTFDVMVAELAASTRHTEFLDGERTESHSLKGFGFMVPGLFGQG